MAAFDIENDIKLIALGIKFSHILFFFLKGTQYLAYPKRPRPQQRACGKRLVRVEQLTTRMFYQKRKIVLKGDGKYPYKYI